MSSSVQLEENIIPKVKIRIFNINIRSPIRAAAPTPSIVAAIRPGGVSPSSHHIPPPPGCLFNSIPVPSRGSSCCVSSCKSTIFEHFPEYASSPRLLRLHLPHTRHSQKLKRESRTLPNDFCKPVSKISGTSCGCAFGCACNSRIATS